MIIEYQHIDGGRHIPLTGGHDSGFIQSAHRSTDSQSVNFLKLGPAADAKGIVLIFK
jgi:hypothetical protein